MSAIRPKAGATMILAGVPIIAAVVLSLTPSTTQSSEAIAAASGHYVTVSGSAGDQSAGTTSLVALSVEPNGGGHRDGDKKDGDKRDGDKKDGDKKPTHKPTETKTVTTPPATKTVTVQPTRTELPVTGGREVSLALAGGGLFMIGVLLLLLKRMARDH